MCYYDKHKMRRI